VLRAGFAASLALTALLHEDHHGEREGWTMAETKKGRKWVRVKGYTRVVGGKKVRVRGFDRSTPSTSRGKKK